MTDQGTRSQSDRTEVESAWSHRRIRHVLRDRERPPCSTLGPYLDFPCMPPSSMSDRTTRWAQRR
jgi:hypothetical protein